MKPPPASSGLDQWGLANQQYLHTQLLRLRLLLARRIVWLRQLWKNDPLQAHQGLVISDAKADALIGGEDCREEAEFYRANSYAAKITQSVTDVEREIARQLKALSDSGQAPAMEVLARLFGLTPFERDVLLLCLAPELDASFERLHAYVQDDVTRKYATPQLALTLFGSTGSLSARESFMPGGQLRRFHLITLEQGPLPAATFATCPMRLTERVANYLLGVNRIDEGVIHLLRPLPPSLLTSDQLSLVDRLYHSIEQEKKRGPWPMINVIGPNGAGKAALAKTLCERMKLQLHRLSVGRLPPDGPERFALYRLLEREAALSQFALYLDTSEMDDASLSNAVASVRDVVDQLGLFLIVGSRERWRAERRTLALEISKPDASAQKSLWLQTLAGVPHEVNGELDALVQQYEFGPAAIHRAVADAQDRVRFRTAQSDAKLTADDLWRACHEQAGGRLNELAQRITPCHSWEDIILPKDVDQQLREIASQVANRSAVYETWGFGAKLNRGRGISALFSGPSGTGKTLAAEILAHHLGLSLYRIDLSGVVSKYIGETEKNLRRVFDAAEQSGAILFFDEADALFGKRSEVKDSHDRYANIEVNYLLQRMEDYRGLAVLATNMKSHLDDAFMRRLRFLVDFPFPDAVHRALIWRKVFPEAATTKDLDYAALSRLEIPGGNIKNIAVNAAFLACAEGGAIQMEHVLQATRREYAKIDKLMLESEFGRYYAMARQ